MELFRCNFTLTLAIMLLPLAAFQSITLPHHQSHQPAFGVYPDCNVRRGLCIAEHITVAENPASASQNHQQGTGIPNISHFTQFECRRNCTIPMFDALRLFERSDRLHQVLLNGSAIAQMSTAAFRQARQLSVLDLSYNLLERLDAAQFSGAVDLQSLRMSHNRLGHIDRRALASCDRLAELFIDHNRLTAFVVDLPVTVEALHLQGNRIGVVQAELPRVVRMLDVSNNEVISFEAATAVASSTSSSRLEYLNVARNRLASLHNITQSHPQLRSLDASSNPIRVYHIFTFAALPRLESLRLRRAGLQHRFGHGLFGDEHATLRTLDIADNALIDADWSALERLPALRELSVAENGLRDLGGNVERVVAGLEKLSIAGNRFNCTYATRLAALLRDDQLQAVENDDDDDDADSDADADFYAELFDAYAVAGRRTTRGMVHGIACENNAADDTNAPNPTHVNDGGSSSWDCKRLRVVLDQQWTAAKWYRIVAVVEGGLLLSLAVMVFWFVSISLWLRWHVVKSDKFDITAVV